MRYLALLFLATLLVLATLYTVQPVRPKITQIVFHPIMDKPGYFEMPASVKLQFFGGPTVLHKYDPIFTTPIKVNCEPFTYDDTNPHSAVYGTLYVGETSYYLHLYPSARTQYTNVINIRIRIRSPTPGPSMSLTAA